jgi:hypothetical protein
MEMNPSWEAVSHTSTEEFPKILRNSKFHCRVHKILPLVSTLSQINPDHNILSYLSKIRLILPFYLRLGLPSGLFPSGFPIKILYTHNY